jgi:hypothetical protein
VGTFDALCRRLRRRPRAVDLEGSAGSQGLCELFVSSSSSFLLCLTILIPMRLTPFTPISQLKSSSTTESVLSSSLAGSSTTSPSSSWAVNSSSTTTSPHSTSPFVHFLLPLYPLFRTKLSPSPSSSLPPPPSTSPRPSSVLASASKSSSSSFSLRFIRGTTSRRLLTLEFGRGDSARARRSGGRITTSLATSALFPSY